MLQAYDQHLNMILGDVDETVTTTEIDEETFEEIIKVIIAYFLVVSCPNEPRIQPQAGAIALYGVLQFCSFAPLLHPPQCGLH